MLKLESLRASMIKLAEQHGLPQTGHDDIIDDMKELERYEGLHLVWLLRSGGSTLVPVGVGVNPIHVTHWLWGSHGERVVAFLIYSNSGVIEKIDAEEAERLVMQMPCPLSSLQKPDRLVHQVNSTLNQGMKMGIWGSFETSDLQGEQGDWGAWQHFFSATGNRLMTSFIGRAIWFTARC